MCVPSLCLVGTLLSIAAWLEGAGVVLLVSGVLLGSVVPTTLIVIAPTNKRLEDRDFDMSSDIARHLLKRWGHLDAVRSA
jgi:predicted amidophosphoribosyltransferase